MGSASAAPEPHNLPLGSMVTQVETEGSERKPDAPDLWSAGPTIEFLLLADHAEAINGKLYLMGGAWDRLVLTDFSQPQRLSLALGILVPWNSADEQFHLTLAIENEDGQVLQTFDANVVQGRPSTAVPGQSFRALLALNGGMVIPSPGTYRVVARLSNGHQKTTTFHVSALLPGPTPLA